MNKETGNTTAVNFLGKVIREQPEIIGDLSPRDAYMLFNYSDPENGRSQKELGEIFGISGSLVSRKIKQSINNVYQKSNHDIQQAYVKQDVINATTSRTKEMRSRNGEVKKKQWEDPDFRARMTEVAKMRWEDPERKRKVSDATRMRWEDPEYKTRVSKKIRERLQEPSHKKRLSKNMKMRWEDPDQRAIMSTASRMRWEDPERKSKMIEKLKTRRQYSKHIDWSVEDPDLDYELWEYSSVHGLHESFLAQGLITHDEHLRLESHFSGKRRKKGKAFQRLLNKFSILIANAA